MSLLIVFIYVQDSFHSTSLSSPPPSLFLLLSSYSPSVIRVFSKLDRRFPATTQPTRIYSHTAHKTWRKERERENVLLLWAMFSRVCVDIRHSTVLFKRRNTNTIAFVFFFLNSLLYTERVPEKKKEGLVGCCWLSAIVTYIRASSI